MEIIILALVWAIIGIAGIVFWWTKEYDFTTEDLILVPVGLALGPISWFVGWVVHGDHSKKDNNQPQKIINRRK
jgi:flagellar basal body-associated protein FliL